MRYSAHVSHHASRSESFAETLKALVRGQHEQLLSRETEIEHLKLLLGKSPGTTFALAGERSRQNGQENGQEYHLSMV
jgi:hypothetical protein